MSRGWIVMRRAIFALLLREVRTRFGKYQLGYAWALIEPVASVSILLVVFTSLRLRGAISGIDFPLFLINGVVINGLFVEISNRSIKAMEANSALFNYRPVRPVDTVFARALLECMLHTIVYSVLVLGYVVLGGQFDLHNFPLLLAVFVLMTVFASGIGILFMVVTDAYTDADRVLPLLTRPLFFISGIFFPLSAIPRDYWPLFLWNPIFHAIELSREAVAPGYRVPAVSLGYLAICALVAITVALLIYRHREQRLRLR